MPSPLHSVYSLLLIPVLAGALTLDCKRIRVDGQAFNLEKLGGPKTVHDLRYESPSIHNTTFTIDICATLEKPKGSKKEDECPTGTRICAKKEIFRDGGSMLAEVIPIAGEFTTSHGRGLEPKITRLKDSDSNTDAQKEGIRMELQGGWYDEVDQKAIIEFICDKDKKGTEGFEEDEKALRFQNMSALDDGSMRGVEDDEDSGDGKPELPDLDAGKALRFVSYGTEKDIGVLRMEWKTKYACEDAVDEKDPDDEKSASSGWGFFTWFLIIAFLAAAAYIIFGSWLNYNRYGARGWDLVPHGDTIRDIPYLLKDWALNLTDRLRGDTRGGYSAV